MGQGGIMKLQSMTKDNPFYFNYVFGQYDLQRAKIKWWHYPALWFRQTYVQASGGYVYYFKRNGRGQIFLMKVEKIDKETK